MEPYEKNVIYCVVLNKYISQKKYFDRRPHQGSKGPQFNGSLQVGYYVMCGAMVGCVVCERYAFFIKNSHLLNFYCKKVGL